MKTPEEWADEVATHCDRIACSESIANIVRDAQREARASVYAELISFFVGYGHSIIACRKVSELIELASKERP